MKLHYYQCVDDASSFAFTVGGVHVVFVCFNIEAVNKLFTLAISRDTGGYTGYFHKDVGRKILLDSDDEGALRWIKTLPNTFNALNVNGVDFEVSLLDRPHLIHKFESTIEECHNNVIVDPIRKQIEQLIETARLYVAMNTKVS